MRPLPGAGAGTLDVLPEDDEVWLHVPQVEAAAVALVLPSASQSPAIERALRADPRARVVRKAPGEPLDDPALRLVVACGVVPRPLPRVSCLVVDPPGDVGPVQVRDRVERPRVEAWDRDDRRLRWAEPREVEVARARRLVLGPGARALVEGSEGALVATFAEGDVLHTVVGFDPLDSSWPLRHTWPIFVRNVLVAALEDEALGPDAAVRAGTAVSLRPSRGAREVEVELPSGRSVALAVDASTGRALLQDTDEVGIYRVRSGEARTTLGVSVLDERETDLAPRAIAIPGKGGSVALEAAREAGREAALPFALLAVALLLVEGFAYHRRV